MSVNTDQKLISFKIASLQDLGRNWMEKWKYCIFTVLELCWTTRENQLWEQGLLGDHMPQTLLDTKLFLCGMSFALRSGQEHWSLRVTQFQLVESVDGTQPYLGYSENCSKNNTGGLTLWMVHHANEANPERCLVRFYKKYLEHRTDIDETASYLAPLKKPKGNVWYSKAPFGHKTLSKTVAYSGSEGHSRLHISHSNPQSLRR